MQSYKIMNYFTFIICTILNLDIVDGEKRKCMTLFKRSSQKQARYNYNNIFFLQKMQKYSTVQIFQVKIHFDNYNIEHLLEENTVCPRRPSLLIGELHLLAWTEQESHACNVNQADRTQHLEVIFQLYVSLYILIIQIFSSASISRSFFR